MSEKEFYDDLLRHKLTTLGEKVPELELAFQGNNLILNVCVAYSRKVAAENVTLKERLDVAEARIEDQDKQIAELRLLSQENANRLDGFAKWAKTFKK